MNVLIVDDIQSVIDGIIQGIRWQNLQEITGVYLATSSEEAKGVFLQKNIDILISDIEMPGENGIELLGWVKDNHPDTQAIILTAHARFEYAHDALKLNCFDYVLQPVDYSVLEMTISRLVAKIVDTRKERELTDQLEQLTSDMDIQVWNDYIISGHCGPETARLRLEALDLPLGCDNQYTLMFIEDVTLKKNLSEWIKNRNLATINDLLTAFFKSDSHYQRTISQKDPQLIHLMCASLTSDEISSILQTMHDLCQNTYAISLAVYWGTADSLDELPAIYQKLQELKSINVASFPKLFSLSDLDSNICHDMPDMLLWARHFVNRTTEMIWPVLENYLKRKIDDGSLNLATLLTLQQCFLNEFYISLQARSINIQDVLNQPDVFDAYTISAKSVDQFRTFIKKIIEVNKTLSTGATTFDPLKMVMQYIGDNIGSDLSRQQIAQHVHISESHLSHLFQKKTGQSLSNYIIEQRMILAKTMLLETQMPIGLVAIKCGYNHFSYFVRAFKKIYGVSPLVYRNLDDVNEEDYESAADH